MYALKTKEDAKDNAKNVLESVLCLSLKNTSNQISKSISSAGIKADMFIDSITLLYPILRYQIVLVFLFLPN